MLSKQSINLADICIYFMVGLGAVICLWPFVYVFSMSISDPGEAARMTIWLFPKGFSLEAYKIIMANRILWRSYGNTVIYTVFSTVLNLFFSAVSAYPLSRKSLFARKWIVMFIIIPLYFSGGLIPYFILMSRLGFYNNPLIMIIPNIITIWNIILVRTYFRTIPDALEESALIDGAGHYQILFKIIIPLSKPILAVIALYCAVGVWNSWFYASIFLPNQNYQPLQVYLTKLLIFNMANFTQGLDQADRIDAINAAISALQLKYAAIIFCSLPIICVYPFLQKYFVKGVMVGSLKE